MKIIFLFFCLFISLPLLSQDFPEIKKEGRRIEDFLPKGWDIIGKAKGDLNKDGLDDFAVVAKDMEEDMNDDKDYNRLLLIIFRDKGKFYVLSDYSYKAIMCKRCGGVTGDPFQSLEIKGGELTIVHYGGSSQRWGITDIFKCIGNEWLLVQEIFSSGDTSDPENTYKETVKMQTDFGKLKMTDFDISKRK
jgi:hypothetical protein